MDTATGRQMRRDGLENRQKLLEVARQIMLESDGDVSLEVIAEKAGVGRGTVYRNFDDRLQLYAAVLTEDLARLRQGLAATGSQNDLTEVMRRFVGMMAIYDRFRSTLPTLGDYTPDGCELADMLALLVEPLRHAKARGAIRPDVDEEEILLACRMVASGWRLDMEPDREKALDRRMRLISLGLGFRDNKPVTI